MKKFTLIFAALLSAIILIAPKSATAQEDSEIEQGFVYEQGYFETESGGFDIDTFLRIFSTEFSDRTNGTNKELQAALFLAEVFSDMGLKTSKIDDADDFEDYLQGFKFGSNQKQSNNVIAVKPAQNQTKQNVVIGAHYDNAYGFERRNPYTNLNYSSLSHGAYDNGSGVAVMMNIAHSIKDKNLPFNVTFIAFGAEESGMNGSSHYVSNISATQRENMLLMVNLDSIAAGDYLYMFCLDWNSGHEGFIRKQAGDLNIPLRALPLNKKFVADPFGSQVYSHYGYFSDNYPFMQQNIPTAIFMSMNWNSKKKAGVVESDINADIMHTENDNYQKLTELYPETYLSNMQNVSDIVIKTLEQQDFAEAMAQSRKDTPTYDFITNPRNLIIMAFTVWLAFVLLSYFYYGKIKKSAEKSIKDFMSDPENIERMNKLFKGIGGTPPFNSAVKPQSKNEDFSVFGKEFDSKEDDENNDK
ncbi:MAG: M28 family peptidase [Clostridia bacterium]|nr:M28 family peptidase [Clostridia bacterium]